MYRFSYSEIREDSAEVGRERERTAFDQALDALREAERRAEGSDRTKAVARLQDLWNVLISDLLDAGNGLPEALRADLVSIGVWNMREVSAVLSTPERSLAALIEVNTSIRDGLR